MARTAKIAAHDNGYTLEWDRSWPDMDRPCVKPGATYGTRNASEVYGDLEALLKRLREVLS